VLIAALITAILGGFARELFRKLFSVNVDLPTPVTQIVELQVTDTPSLISVTKTPSPSLTETFTPSPQPSLTSTSIEESTSDLSSIETCVELGEIVFEEVFDSNDQFWHVGDVIDYPYTDEERAVVSGIYRISALFQDDALSTSTIPFVNLKNFALAFDATFSSKSGTGPARVAVFFRIDDAGNYYTARFGDDGLYSIFIRQEEFFMPLIDWEQSDAFDLSIGVTNKFLIIADGWRLTICADGMEIASVLDSSINSVGRIGIGLSGVKGVSVVGNFDNVEVRKVHKTITPTP